MHLYKEQPGDTVFKQPHPNGTLHLYTVLKNGKQANGWSRKKYYPDASLEEEENFSNGLLIEKINFSESGGIISHKIWNNRLKAMVDKPAFSPLTKHNVVTGSAPAWYFVKHMPSISEYICADYNEASLLQFFTSAGESGKEEATWTLKGKQMSYSIYWVWDEFIYQWHCHCFTEELYLKAKIFLKSKKV